MRQFLLFAGCASTNLKGIHGFVGDYASFAEAFIALVDRQIASEWWHVDTVTRRDGGQRRVAAWMVRDGDSHLVPVRPASD